MKNILLAAFLICTFSAVSFAQFNSGSTGADGALDLSTMTCPQNVCEVQLPESGILNYTTVNIPSPKTLVFKRNSRNTPVILLAQGNVTIGGVITLNASGRIPGPGGFYGGQYLSGVSFPGLGPGGGTTTTPNGRWIGPLSLVPIVGGSGGSALSGIYTFDGGGGGGAIVIASSTSINQTGSIIAQGSLLGGNPPGPLGSGGAIRLVANSLNAAGASFSACNTNYNSACGVVRLEATNLTFTGGSTPPATLAPINPNIISTAQPQLTIQSVGGYAVPTYAGSRFDTVDLLLPNQIPDPVNVVVSANNIPVGTEVSVGFVSGSPNGTSAPCNLSGTLASSSCTATISNLNRTGVTYLLATASFTPPAPLAAFNPKGADFIAKIRLDSVLGAKPKYVFLRSDNSIIDTKKVSKEILQYFGM